MKKFHSTQTQPSLLFYNAARMMMNARICRAPHLQGICRGQHPISSAACAARARRHPPVDAPFAHLAGSAVGAARGVHRGGLPAYGCAKAQGSCLFQEFTSRSSAPLAPPPPHGPTRSSRGCRRARPFDSLANRHPLTQVTPHRKGLRSTGKHMKFNPGISRWVQSSSVAAPSPYLRWRRATARMQLPGLDSHHAESSSFCRRRCPKCNSVKQAHWVCYKCTPSAHPKEPAAPGGGDE